jgi:flagellar hook-associated protein 2
MGISALGTGSSILTQDLIDKLKAADTTAQIQPLDFSLADNKDKAAEYDVIDANMTNLYDAIGELKTPALFDERTTSVSGSSVAITADANSDVQDFTLDVTQLATKEVEETGSYSATDAKIADAAGTFTLKVGGDSFDIDYDDTTTLEDLKNSINRSDAGDKVQASIVKIGESDYRLFLTAVETGDLNSDNDDDDGTDSTLDISIVDSADGHLKGTQLTDDMKAVQVGQDAKFTYNGEDVTRSSNKIDDLVTGYHITLESTGKSEISVTQNRDNITGKIDSFIEKYNATMDELERATKNSTDSSERGIFAGDSTFKAMQRDLRSMMDDVGGGVGTLYDFGFDIDKNGKMSIDKTVFNEKMDENPANVEAFFSGGDFTNSDGTTTTVTTVTGAFSEMSDKTYSYTKFNGMLDNYKTYLDENTSRLEESKTKATERLDAKYEIMKQQFSAYDAMIALFDNASAAFTQMQDASNNNN